MYVIVWRFRPRAGREADFERAYGAGGAWADLFRRGAGFLGTELLRGTDGSRDYLTLDRWDSRAAHDAFAERWASEYAALDRDLEELTEVEVPIGSYEEPGPAGTRA